MAFQSHVFSLIGDSNVKRHMNPMNCRDRPMMSSCQVLPCGRLSALAETLKSIRQETSVAIIACLTNFLTASEEAGSSVCFRIDPVLREALSVINEAAVSLPDLCFVVSPPMYRTTPIWYRDSLPEVLTKFSEVFKGRSVNVHLMSSFATPVLEPDGVHLTAYSGLEFVLHLFDNASALVKSLTSSLDEVSIATIESTRVLEDRMMAIEQDHRRLNVSVESKTAEDAELFDFQQNIRFENCFTISGLQRHPEGLSPKEWQDRVKRDVQGALTALMGREYPIVVVLNSTSKRKDAPATYHVQLQSVEASAEIRTKFGTFFLGSVDKRPEAVKGFSIQNRVTPATSVRIAILKVFGQRYTASNPGSKFKVIGYETRPLLKITPAQDATDRRVQSYNFCEAIKVLPSNFTPEEIDQIMKKVSPKLHGKLRPLFSVISDDMVKRGSKKSSKESGNSGRSSGSGVNSSSSSGGRGGGSGGSSSGRGRGQSTGRGGGASGSNVASDGAGVNAPKSSSPSGASPTDPRVNNKRGATSPASGGPQKQPK